MTYKKKLKLRKYTKGGTLPKFQGGTQLYNPELGYLNENTNMFTPQVNDPTLNVGNKNVSVDTSNTDNISGGLGTAASIAGVARQFIDGSNNDPNNVQYANQTSSLANTLYNTTPVGSAVNTVLGTVGETVKTNKDYVNYDEYGHNQVATGKGIGYEVGSESLDPLTAASDYLDTGEYGKSALAAAGFGWMTGMDDYFKNEAEADKLEREAHNKEMNALNKNKLNQINTNTQTYLPVTRYGGKLRRYVNGGGLEDPLKPLQSTGFSPIPIEKYDYEITPATEYVKNVRHLTGNQFDNMAREQGYTQEEISANPERIQNEMIKLNNRLSKYTDSTGKTAIDETYINRNYPPRATINIKKVPYQDPMLDSNAINDLNLNMKKEGGSLNQDKRLVKRPIIRRYTGQTHEGRDGGIAVDGNGNPTSMTGNQPVGLTEKGEVSYNGYIFSEYLKRSKKK